MNKQNHLDISFKATYATLNKITPSTKHIWIVCHGYGQLAEYFIKKFDVFDPEEHFILAPQGLSKFYLHNDYQKVGASWMTKYDRETDLENQKKYFDGLFEQVFKNVDLGGYKLHLFGFSQGVSMISRLAAYKKLAFDNLILWAGGFPSELSPKDFNFIKSHANLKIILGNQDSLYQMPRFQDEINKADETTRLTADLIRFEGKHVVDREVLKTLL